MGSSSGTAAPLFLRMGCLVDHPYVKPPGGITVWTSRSLSFIFVIGSLDVPGGSDIRRHRRRCEAASTDTFSVAGEKCGSGCNLTDMSSDDLTPCATEGCSGLVRGGAAKYCLACSRGVKKVAGGHSRKKSTRQTQASRRRKKRRERYKGT